MQEKQNLPATMTCWQGIDFVKNTASTIEELQSSRSCNTLDQQNDKLAKPRHPELSLLSHSNFTLSSKTPPANLIVSIRKVRAMKLSLRRESIPRWIEG